MERVIVFMYINEIYKNNEYELLYLDVIRRKYD